MNNSRLWLLFSSAVSIGLGFAGGMMVRSKRPVSLEPIGRLYEVDGETYIDGALVDFLRPRADANETRPCSTILPCPGEWTVLRFRTVMIFVKRFLSRPLLPRQSGALYVVHLHGDTSEESGRDVRSFLQKMIDLGLVEFGGRWKSWAEISSTPNRRSA